MSRDELPYDAIVIDTSIFEQNGLKLEDGYLGKLTQFKNSPVNFILPDIVVNEIKSHLDQKTLNAYESLKKSINDARKYLYFKDSPLEEPEDSLPSLSEIQKLGDTRIENFIKNTGVEVIESEKYVTMTPLIKKYFEKKPPFANSGNKKSEFPDAIALMAIENWAKEEGKSVIAITKDGDWKSFCDESDNMDYEEELSTGLAHFHKVNFASILIEAIINNEIKNLDDEIERYLEGNLNDINPDQDAESIYYWEPEGVETTYQSFTLLKDDPDAIEIIDYVMGKHITIKVPANIMIEATGYFSVYIRDSIDKDFMPMGSQTITIEYEFETDLLITLVGDFADIQDLYVEDIEIISPPSYIHFGEISLDFWADQY